MNKILEKEEISNTKLLEKIGTSVFLQILSL